MRMSDWSSDVCSSDLNIRSSVRSEYDAALAQENLLTSKLASLRTQTLDVDSRSIQYNILKREADTNRQLYDALLQRYKEIGVAGGVSANNIAIVDRALPPRGRSEEHTSELQSLMRISYAVFCLKKKKTTSTSHK